MKRFLSILLVASLMLVTASCGLFKPRGAEVITDHETIEQILQEHFPDLYELHEQGTVEVDEIYIIPTRSGEPKYKVSLRYMPPHGD